MFRSMRRVSFVLLTTLTLSLVFVLPASAASPGDLDTTFNTTGTVTTDFGGTVDVGWALAIQANDGKIVVAGYANPIGAPDSDFALARYHGLIGTGAPGTLDTTFGTLGKVTTDFGSPSDDSIHAVAIQGDGKIVAAGWTNVNGNFDFALARYNPDGSLDTIGFGTLGLVVTPLAGAQFAQSVAIQSDGSIVVGGYSTQFGTDDFFLVRYDSSGNLDTGFNGSGMITADFGGSADRIESVVIQSSDQKIVVAGSSDQVGTQDVVVARYGITGVLDVSFDGDGVATTDVGGPAIQESRWPSRVTARSWWVVVLPSAARKAFWCCATTG